MIIRQSKLDKMTVSKSLKKLVTQGLVKRVEERDSNYFSAIKKTDRHLLLNQKCES